MNIYIMTSSKTSPTDLALTRTDFQNFRKVFEELQRTETIDHVIMGTELGNEEIKLLKTMG